MNKMEKLISATRAEINAGKAYREAQDAAKQAAENCEVAAAALREARTDREIAYGEWAASL